jgi:hypothetical protein
MVVAYPHDPIAIKRILDHFCLSETEEEKAPPLGLLYMCPSLSRKQRSSMSRP